MREKDWARISCAIEDTEFYEAMRRVKMAIAPVKSVIMLSELARCILNKREEKAKAKVTKCSILRNAESINERRKGIL